MQRQDAKKTVPLSLEELNKKIAEAIADKDYDLAEFYARGLIEKTEGELEACKELSEVVNVKSRLCDIYNARSLMRLIRHAEDTDMDVAKLFLKSAKDDLEHAVDLLPSKETRTIKLNVIIKKQLELLSEKKTTCLDDGDHLGLIQIKVINQALLELYKEEINDTNLLTINSFLYEIPVLTDAKASQGSSEKKQSQDQAISEQSKKKTESKPIRDLIADIKIKLNETIFKNNDYAFAIELGNQAIKLLYNSRKTFSEQELAEQLSYFYTVMAPLYLLDEQSVASIKNTKLCLKYTRKMGVISKNDMLSSFIITLLEDIVSNDHAMEAQIESYKKHITIGGACEKILIDQKADEIHFKSLYIYQLKAYLVCNEVNKAAITLLKLSDFFKTKKDQVEFQTSLFSNLVPTDFEKKIQSSVLLTAAPLLLVLLRTQGYPELSLSKHHLILGIRQFLLSDQLGIGVKHILLHFKKAIEFAKPDKLRELYETIINKCIDPELVAYSTANKLTEIFRLINPDLIDNRKKYPYAELIENTINKRFQFSMDGPGSVNHSSLYEEDDSAAMCLAPTQVSGIVNLKAGERSDIIHKLTQLKKDTEATVKNISSTILLLSNIDESNETVEVVIARINSHNTKLAIEYQKIESQMESFSARLKEIGVEVGQYSNADNRAAAITLDASIKADINTMFQNQAFIVSLMGKLRHYKLKIVDDKQDVVKAKEIAKPQQIEKESKENKSDDSKPKVKKKKHNNRKKKEGEKTKLAIPFNDEKENITDFKESCKVIIKTIKSIKLVDVEDKLYQVIRTINSTFSKLEHTEEEYNKLVGKISKSISDSKAQLATLSDDKPESKSSRDAINRNKVIYETQLKELKDDLDKLLNVKPLLSQNMKTAEEKVNNHILKRYKSILSEAKTGFQTIKADFKMTIDQQLKRHNLDAQETQAWLEKRKAEIDSKLTKHRDILKNKLNAADTWPSDLKRSSSSEKSVKSTNDEISNSVNMIDKTIIQQINELSDNATSKLSAIQKREQADKKQEANEKRKQAQEMERRKQQQQEEERRENEKRENERLEREKIEKDKLEKDNLERLEKERLEKLQRQKVQTERERHKKILEMEKANEIERKKVINALDAELKILFNRLNELNKLIQDSALNLGHLNLNMFRIELDFGTLVESIAEYQSIFKAKEVELNLSTDPKIIEFKKQLHLLIQQQNAMKHNLASLKKNLVTFKSVPAVADKGLDQKQELNKNELFSFYALLKALKKNSPLDEVQSLQTRLEKKKILLKGGINILGGVCRFNAPDIAASIGLKVGLNDLDGTIFTKNHFGFAKQLQEQEGFTIRYPLPLDGNYTNVYKIVDGVEIELTITDPTEYQGDQIISPLVSGIKCLILNNEEYHSGDYECIEKINDNYIIVIDRTSPCYKDYVLACQGKLEGYIPYNPKIHTNYCHVALKSHRKSMLIKGDDKYKDPPKPYVSFSKMLKKLEEAFLDLFNSELDADQTKPDREIRRILKENKGINKETQPFVVAYLRAWVRHQNNMYRNFFKDREYLGEIVREIISELQKPREEADPAPVTIEWVKEIADACFQSKLNEFSPIVLYHPYQPPSYYPPVGVPFTPYAPDPYQQGFLIPQQEELRPQLQWLTRGYPPFVASDQGTGVYRKPSPPVEQSVSAQQQPSGSLGK